MSGSALQWASPGCDIADSKDMNLEEITRWLSDRPERHETVVLLQTGDPGLYGALAEMAGPLDRAGIRVVIVPGVSCDMA